MEYHIKILLLAFAVAFVISLIIIPILRKRKIGQSEREKASGGCGDACELCQQHGQREYGR